MTDVEVLLKNTVEELDRLLNAKNVLGDPIEKDGSTVIPIVSYGFGFGAGGTDGAKSGNGGGTGAGGGIKRAMSGLTEVLGDAAAHAIDTQKNGKAKED